MNDGQMKDPMICYLNTKQRAFDYYQKLERQMNEKDYAIVLKADLKKLKSRSPLFYFILNRRKQTDAKGYRPYLQWLNETGKLDSYFNRSVSYIFMRDLGKRLDSAETVEKIDYFADSLKKYLLDAEKGKSDFSMASLYRLAQKENVESTFIWLINKLKWTATIIPNGLDADNAQRKLIKIIAGVILHETEERMGMELSDEEKERRLDRAIRLGYAYGLTYPFIDDLLDANILSEYEKNKYAGMIRETLTMGVVPELEEWSGDNAKLVNLIHLEFREAFNYMKSQQNEKQFNVFLKEAFIFFHAQEVDREKKLDHSAYTNEELYIPIIMKSSSSRMIVRSLLEGTPDEGYLQRTFYYGIYNQLADDFADMFDDQGEGRVTPYTYYMRYHKERADLVNPFELYWTVVSNLIHEVFDSERKTCEIVLRRAINGLKRFRDKHGQVCFDSIMKQFELSEPVLQRLIMKLVSTSRDIDFLDKLLRDHLLSVLKSRREEKDKFLEISKDAQKQINEMLPISNTERLLQDDLILKAANYSLESGGKRLRPIMTRMMSVQEYDLDLEQIIPLLKSLEYMHTASLIFDDLPAQDNAPLRRGRATLHQVYNTAIAELTGLFLNQRAYEEQASLEGFDPQKVLELIRYSAHITAEMCQGQAMDLEAKGKQLNLKQLNDLSLYKTGLGFEAAIIMPAILKGVPDIEKEALKQFARHAGIAFQIKDDLLDVEGETSIIGKEAGRDAANESSTFVSILGIEGARKMMWEHYCLAMEALENVPLRTNFLEYVLDYMLNRKK